MQLFLLAGISLLFAVAAVWTCERWLADARQSPVKPIPVAISFGLNALSTVVLDALLKAGRPTFYYHTHPIGMTTFKLFLLSCGLASLAYALFLFFLQTRSKKRTAAPEVSAFLIHMLALCLLGACLTELFVFNLRHYELIGQRKPQITLERGDFQPYGFYFNRASQRYTSYDLAEGQSYGFSFYVRGQKIRNIQLPFFSDDPQIRVQLRYTDAAFEFPRELPEHLLLREVPQTYNIPLHTNGETYRIELIFPDVERGTITEYALNSVTFNQKIPLRVVPARVLLSFLGLLLICLFAPRSPLYQVRLDFKSRAQKAALAAMVLAMMGCFGWVTWSNFSRSALHYPNQQTPITAEAAQYNQLTAALQAGSLSLLTRPENGILTAERPYDLSYREYYDLHYQWDMVLYNGKYYVYFGVVPAVTLLLPWKLLTGEFLRLEFAVLFFCCLGLAGLYGFYSRVVPKAFSALPLPVYCAGWIMLSCALNLTWCLRRSQDYELAITAGFCFIAWAVFLFWRGLEVRGAIGSPMLLFASGGAAALAVGCRPTLLFVSLLFPFLAAHFYPSWVEFFTRKTLWRALAFLLPYAAVGLLLMKYNAARFGSITEFGIHYQLTAANQSLGGLRIGLSGILLSFVHYFFTPLRLDLTFPFIHLTKIAPLYNGFLYHDNPMLGLFAFPFLLFLLLMGMFRKALRAKRIYGVTIGCLLVGLILCVCCCLFSVSLRYTVDFVWLLGLAAIFCCFACWERFSQQGMARWAALGNWLMLGACVAIFAAVSLTGEGDWFSRVNPLYFHQLGAALSFWQ